MQRHRAAVACERVAVRRQPSGLDLQALDRGVDIANRAARSTLLAHDVPRFERLSQLDFCAERRQVPDLRKAELEMWIEPLWLQAIASARELFEHVAKVALDE